MDKEKSGGDLILVRKIPLNGALIADILAVYIRCEPTVEPYNLPLFRVEELCDKLSEDCPDDASVLEMVGALYALCMYHSISATFSPSIIRNVASKLMSIATECISCLELNRSISYAHPVDTIEYQKYNNSSEDLLFDTFRYSLELSREILREITRPVRMARDKSKAAQTANRLPVEAVRPNIILFMCTFALTHIAAVLGAKNELLTTIPGLVETLLLLMSVKYGMKENSLEGKSVGTKLPVAEEGERIDKNLVKAYFTLRSMELTSRLSCVISQLVLDPAILTQVSAITKKQQKNIENEDVDYAKLKVTEAVSFLKSPHHLGEKINTVLLLETAGDRGQKSKASIGTSVKSKSKIPHPRCFDTDGLFTCGGSYFTHAKQVRGALETQRQDKLRAIAKKLADDANNKAAGNSFNNNNAGETGAAAMGGIAKPKTIMNAQQKIEEAAAIELVNNCGLDVTSEEVDLMDTSHFELAEHDGYRNIKPMYRWAYLATYELRNSSETVALIKNSYLKTYNPIKTREFHLSLSVKNLKDEHCEKSNTSKRDDLECLYYEQMHYVIPRVMNPFMGQFWLCLHVIDYILELHDKKGISVFAAGPKAKLHEEINAIKAVTAAFENHSVTLSPVRSDLVGIHDKHHHHAAISIQRHINTSDAKDRVVDVNLGKSKSNTPGSGPRTAEDGRSHTAASKKSAAQSMKEKMNKLLMDDPLAAQVHILQSAAENKKRSTKTADKEVTRPKEHAVTTSLMEKNIFDNRRHGQELELTLKDRLTLAGRMGRAEACLDMVKEDKKKMKRKELEEAALKADMDAMFTPKKTGKLSKSTTKTINLKSHSAKTSRKSISGQDMKTAADDRVDSGPEKKSRDQSRGATPSKHSVSRAGSRGGSRSCSPEHKIKTQVLSPVKLLGATIAVVSTVGLSAAESRRATEQARHVDQIVRQRHISVVWSSCASMLDEPDPTAAFAKKSGALAAMPAEFAANEYARQIMEWKASVKQAAENQKQLLTDQQEMEVGKLRTHKLASLRAVREHRSATIKESLRLKQQYKDELLGGLKSSNAAKRDERARLEKMNEREKIRINEIREWVQHENEEKEITRKNLEEYEKIRIRAMADKKEYTEIIRRAEEEARMKYLEERRREIEKAKELEQKKIEDALKEKQSVVKEETYALIERIRDGNFRYHNGKYGFYDHVRKEPVPYTRYFDDDGTPYYHDSILDRTTYVEPIGVPIRNAEDIERLEYDTAHGEGAWEELQFQTYMMNSVNQHGGYSDYDGNWIVVDGHYDEEGYFIENVEEKIDYNGTGKKKFKAPKATGTLDFMI